MESFTISGGIHENRKVQLMLNWNLRCLLDINSATIFLKVQTPLFSVADISVLNRNSSIFLFISARLGKLATIGLFDSTISKSLSSILIV